MNYRTNSPFVSDELSDIRTFSPRGTGKSDPEKLLIYYLSWGGRFRGQMGGGGRWVGWVKEGHKSDTLIVCLGVRATKSLFGKGLLFA